MIEKQGEKGIKKKYIKIYSVYLGILFGTEGKREKEEKKNVHLLEIIDVQKGILSNIDRKRKKCYNYITI